MLPVWRTTSSSAEGVGHDWCRAPRSSGRYRKGGGTQAGLSQAAIADQIELKSEELASVRHRLRLLNWSSSAPLIS
jgi:hypothetical protein